MGNVIFWLDRDVGKVTAAAAGHQDFFTGLCRMFEDQDVALAFTGLNCAHQSGRPRSDYDDIGFQHSLYPEKRRTIQETRTNRQLLITRSQGCALAFAIHGVWVSAIPAEMTRSAREKELP